MYDILSDIIEHVIENGVIHKTALVPQYEDLYQRPFLMAVGASSSTTAVRWLHPSTSGTRGAGFLVSGASWALTAGGSLCTPLVASPCLECVKGGALRENRVAPHNSRGNSSSAAARRSDRGLRPSPPAVTRAFGIRVPLLALRGFRGANPWDFTQFCTRALPSSSLTPPVRCKWCHQFSDCSDISHRRSARTRQHSLSCQDGDPFKGYPQEL